MGRDAIGSNRLEQTHLIGSNRLEQIHLLFQTPDGSSIWTFSRPNLLNSKTKIEKIENQFAL